MAQTIKLKRSATQGATPTTSQLELGEVAINTYDGKMYIKKSVGGTESIVEITGGSGTTTTAADAILIEYQYTATSSQTTFSGSDDNSETLSYTADAIQVFLNGVLLDPAIDYTATNGTSVVLSAATTTGDYLQIFAFKKRIADGNVSVDTFTGNNSTTAFTLSVNPGDENNTRVFIDGVYQSKSNYSVSGTTLTFSTAPPTDTAIEVEIGNRAVTLDTASSINLLDNSKLQLGTSQDADFYHDGTDTYLRNQTGQLLIRGNDTKLQSYLGETYATFANNGAATLYYDNSVKFATTSSGIQVTGNIANTSGNLILDVASSIILDSDAGNVYLRDHNTDVGLLSMANTDLYIRSLVSNRDIIFQGYDSGSNITALTLDMSNNGKALFNHGATFASNVVVYGNGGAPLDWGDTSTLGQLTFDGSGNPVIRSSVSNKSLVIQGVDAGASINALTLDMANAGAATFNAGATFGSGIDVTGTVTADSLTVGDSHTIGNGTGDNLFIQSSSGENITLRAGSTREILLQTDNSSGNAVQIYANNDVAFYEDTGNTPKLTWDASAELLEVSSTGNGYAFRPSSTSSDYALMHVQAQDGTALAAIRLDGSSGLRFHTNGTNNTAEKMRIDSSGNVGIGTTSPSSMLHLQDASDPIEIRLEPQGQANYPKLVGASAAGTNDTYFAVDFVTRGEALRIDGETGNVGIGTTSPAQPLHVYQGGGYWASVSRGNSTPGGSDPWLGLFNNINIANANFGWGIYDSNSDGSFQIWNKNNSTSGYNTFTIKRGGNVGIGTTSPSAKLHIVDTGWSSGAPYGTVQLIEGNNVNDNNWGHLVVTDTTTSAGNGGSISFATGTSSALNPFAGIKGVSEGAAYGGIGLFTRASGGTATERMRINSAGNVGIGTTSPSGRVHASGDAYTAFIADGTSGGAFKFYKNGSQHAQIFSDGSGDIIFRNNSDTERMRLDSSGKIKAQTAGGYYLTESTTDAFSITSNGANGDLIITDEYNSQERLRVKQSGRVGIGTSSPITICELEDAQAQLTIDSTGSAYSRVVHQHNGTSLWTTGTRSASDYHIYRESGSGNVIVDAGNVGIGTSSPANLMHLEGTGVVVGATQLTLEGRWSGYGAGIEFVSRTTSGGTRATMAKITADGENSWTTTASTQDAGLRFSTTEDGTLSEKMRISASGNVGVGRAPVGIGAFTIVEAYNNASSGGFFNAINNTGEFRFVKESNHGYLNMTDSGSTVFQSNGSERMRIDSSGLVGIGTSLPASALHVVRNTNNYVARFENTDATSPYTIWIREPSSASSGYPLLNITDNAGSSTYFRVDSGTGSVFVGTASAPTGSTGGSGFIAESVGRKTLKIACTTTSGAGLAEFINPNGIVGTIVTNGSSTSYNTSSDQRLKDNIVDAPSASDDIDAIQVRSFDWKVNGEHQKYGMVAQELQTVAPEAVTGDADSDEMMAVDYSKLVPMLVKALQESRQEINNLKSRVEELESQ